MKINRIIILDDDARGNVLKFIKQDGLKLMKEMFKVEKVAAVIGDTEMSQLELYFDTNKERVYTKPNSTTFPKDTAIGILETIQAENQNLLILCDREWVVDKCGVALRDPFIEIVSAFNGVQLDGQGKKRFEKIIMVFYTTIYEQNCPSIPNSSGDVIIEQKAILDWDWGDAYSSLCRLRNLLTESKSYEFKNSDKGEL